MPKKTRLEQLSLGDITTTMMHAIKRVPVKHLSEYFEQTCDRRQYEIAVICGSARLTYQELDNRANRLAHLLISRGVGNGKTIGILLERSFDTYIALLGVLKAGAAFIPLDPSFPSDLVAYIAKDARLQDLVTTSKFRDKTRTLSCSVLELDQEHETLNIQPENRPQILVDPVSLCYIMYTFDTTGRPKGVAVSHANIVHSLRLATPIYRVTHNDRVYQGMSIALNFSIAEIWSTWIAGATLVVGSTDSQNSGQGLTAYLDEYKVTVLYCKPGLLATIERDVPSLRSLIIVDGVCSSDLVRRWSRPSRRMLNTYGSAEMTLMVTWCELFPGRPVTLGSPLPTYQIYILNAQRALVEDGESGEIYIGGSDIANGYLNLPELTNECFIPNPVWRDREVMPWLYRTREFGRITAAGEVEYVGRIDNQIYNHGSRIGDKIEKAVFPWDHSAALNKDEYKLGSETTRLINLKRMSLKNIYQHVLTDPLYKNSLFNMAGTFILGGLGFVFWIIIARLYNTEQVGIATTLISIMALLSSLTLLGLASTLMRHLPKSIHKNELINSSFVLVMLASLLVSTIFLLGLHIFSPKLMFVQSNLFYIISFIFFIIFCSWNTLVECTFMAFRAAGNILKKNIIVSVLKLVLPFIFIVFGAYGIFVSFGLALSIGVFFSFAILIFNFKIKPSFSINFPLIKETSRYSFANYISGFAWNMPSLVLPVIILNTFSAKYAAYYYVASMIQTNLQVIPGAVNQALLTEGSYNEAELKKHVKKALIITFLVLVPAIAVIVFGGEFILQFFGKNYADEAIQFLRLYSIATLFTALILIADSILNVQHRIKTFVILNVTSSALTLGLSCAFISNKLVGIGWGWLLGQAISGVVAMFFIIQVFATRSSIAYKSKMLVTTN